MHVRKIEITNFRSIKNLIWFPSKGINCVVGVGDSGKSTILDALEWCLGARRSQLPKTAIGSTLLLKGLEADHVVVLNADKLDAKNLYVAMTRGAKTVTLCCKTQTIGAA